MKNKKLFAILTLVCFMFTLMPVAAFAAVDAKQVYVNGYEETEVTSGVEFQAVVGTTASGYDFFMVDEDGEGVAVSADGKFTVKAAGDYKVYALAETKEITDYINSVATPATKVATLQAAFADAIDEYDYAEVEIVTPDMEYRIRFVDANDKDITKTGLTISANNGFNAGNKDNVFAVLEKSVKKADKWSALKGMDLTLTTVGYVDAAFVEGATTDKNGMAEFEVVSATTGDFKVVAKWGSTKATLDVTVNGTTLKDVEVYNEPVAPVNIDNDVEKANIEFKFTDASGAAYDVDPATEVEFVLVEKPAASKMEAKYFGLTQQAEDQLTGVDKDPKGVFTLTYAKGASKVFDKEGTYVIKAALENGASATATVKVAEMGEIVAIKFNKAPVTVAYDAVDAPVLGYGVIAVDANGVAGAPEDAVTYSVSGKAVKNFAGGKVTLKADEDYIGSTITVYAVSGDFTVANTLTVVDSASLIKYTNTTAEVGVNNVLYAYILDANGKTVTLNSATPQAIVLEAPKDAVVIAKADTYTAKKGVELNLLANKAGEYTIQTIVTYWDGAATRYISSIDTFTVGAGEGTFEDVVVVSIGADKIIVNNEVKAIPAAAVIKDSRTFVPFRALAEAFGADVDYDQATGAVTAELNGVKVVMMNGEKAYTVNGVAKVADVAPYLNVEASTTMVPVSFIANEFGINYQCIYAEDGTVADVLFTK